MAKEFIAQSQNKNLNPTYNTHVGIKFFITILKQFQCQFRTDDIINCAGYHICKMCLRSRRAPKFM